MATTFTRSSRRTEALSTRSSSRNHAILPGNNDLNIGRPQPPNVGRKKRPRADEQEDVLDQKRTKLSIEISSHPRKNAVQTRSVVLPSEPDAKSAPAPKPTKPKTKAKATSTTKTTPTTLKIPKLTTKPTKHHDKVVNGIRHELDRLQPVVHNGLDPGKLLQEEKRKLRSQESTRFKSELSSYFPEYDEIIGNEPKPSHILNLDTPIVMVDTAKTKQPLKSHDDYALEEFPEELFAELNDAVKVDFSFMERTHTDDGEDPLSDEILEVIHKKPERAEKSLRNTDKGRAQHEKDQVIRLLEGLQGPEWLKVMGVSGITDSRRKEYEPARTYFIRGCEVVIEKFRIWREDEKKRKLEKEAALAEAEAEADEDEVEVEDEEMPDADAVSQVSDGDPPDYSDVDASAARQLHKEAIERSAPRMRGGAGRKKTRNSKTAHEPQIVEEKEFKSYFHKPHLRDAAVGKSRRSARMAAAWGQPVPEVHETDFDLPKEYRDEETLKARERRKRREKRVSKG